MKSHYRNHARLLGRSYYFSAGINAVCEWLLAEKMFSGPGDIQSDARVVRSMRGNRNRGDVISLQNTLKIKNRVDL